MCEPKRAIVRPRVLLQGEQDAVLLEDLVAELAADDGWIIELFGEAGSGVSTALQYIASAFQSNDALIIEDWNRAASSFAQPPSGTMMSLRTSRSANPAIRSCRLLGWSRDECIEYLLAAHPSHCASVMQRILNDSMIDRLRGNPSIVRQVLDELAADLDLADVKSAMQRLIERHFPDIDSKRAVVSGTLDKGRSQVDFDKNANDASSGISIQRARLCSLPYISFLFKVEVAWHDLEHKTDLDPSCLPWSREFIMAIAERVAGAPMVQRKLRSWMSSRQCFSHSLAVSLLHASGVSHRTLKELFVVPPARMKLDGAILNDADGSGISLERCLLRGAFFERARLERVSFANSDATNADFRYADLNHAQLKGFIGVGADFTGADFSNAIGSKASFVGAELSLANLEEVDFCSCDLRDSDLSGANFQGAKLIDCIFGEACLNDANFRNANLTRSRFNRLDLSVAHFDKACFRKANLNECRFEGMELADVVFESANLKNAIMTNSIMRRANFVRANLQGAKLADVEWESADLRKADLRGATFHMGSSRSGLVGSPIASEGSRTGFYTDELNEQDFKAPEEIRKANLRGADLRGAKIDGVDFYLVDLRDARFDSRQAEHFRRTGAILVTRKY
jgi:uncharacterized protein YjbI with pentapeptide repeats